jgi:prepilin-type N-terminal cleavage/methylation domain-containing protein/prepilin-type processing-associated H-X9-DG protein
VSKRAFTLVECLVVIGLIGLLLALLLPALQRARRQAESTQCLSNLRQIGTALVNYDVDYHRLPRPGQLGIERVDDWIYWQRGRDFTSGVLYRYTGGASDRVYVCPTDATHTLRPYPYSYSASSALLSIHYLHPSQRLSRVRNASTVRMVYCEDSTTVDDGTMYVDDQGWIANRLSTRHDRRSEGKRNDDGYGNVGYADGHAARIRRVEAYGAVVQ